MESAVTTAFEDRLMAGLSTHVSYAHRIGARRPYQNLERSMVLVVPWQCKTTGVPGQTKLSASALSALWA